VLLEVFLPDVQAGDLIPQMKRIIPQMKRIRPDVIIIAMTGLNSRELEQKIRRQGILYYMIKPLRRLI
jgi:response regulator of citrate/malate metabolism